MPLVADNSEVILSTFVEASLDRASYHTGGRFRRGADRRPGGRPWTLSVAAHVTSVFPPALLTVGNVDPLRPHSELLVEKLRAQGVEPETLFYPDDYKPPLDHEYQFDLDTDAGQLFLKRTLAFLQLRLQPPANA